MALKTAMAVLTAMWMATSAAQTVKTRPLNIDGAATIGAYAVDMSTGKATWAYNEDLWLTPASLTKILTTGAALQTKGPAARIRTHIQLTTDTQGRHSLRIVGEFDPTHASRHFAADKMKGDARRLAVRLTELGVTRIESISVDDSRDPADAYSPRMLWEDMGNYYGAPPATVCYNDNSAALYFSTPAAAGDACDLDSIVPRIDGLSVTTDVASYGGSADHCQVRWLGPLEWHATGELPRGRKALAVKSVLPDPALHYAQAMADLLRGEGIEVGGVGTGEYEPGREVMTIESPTIAEIVKVTNHESVNLFADALALNMALGRKSGGRVSYDEAAGAVSGFWKERCGLDMRLFDGSGLSPIGAASAKTFVSAIVAMSKSGAWDAFRESLPIVGRSGSVSTLGGGLAVSGHARAKSGTLTGVVGYAGVVTTASGRNIAFCIIVNHHKEGVWVVRGEIAKWLNKIYNDMK